MFLIQKNLSGQIAFFFAGKFVLPFEEVLQFYEVLLSYNASHSTYDAKTNWTKLFYNGIQKTRTQKKNTKIETFPFNEES